MLRNLTDEMDVHVRFVRYAPRGVVLAASLLIGSGCGQSARPITFDSTVPTEAPATVSESTTTPLPTQTGGRGPTTDAAWVDATANLAGLDSECGNLSFLSARPDRDTLIAGVAKQGLFESDNGGAKWTRLGDSAVIDNRATSIIYDPNDPKTFWESGIYGAGVFKTTDNGATFRRLDGIAHSDEVSVDLTDPKRQTLLSGTHEQPRVFLSTNGGSTWKDISAGLPANIGYASSPHVIDSRTYLLGTRAGTKSGVFRTTDGGATWSLVHPGGVSGPPLVAKSDQHLYWLLDQGGGLITSKDGGATWTEVRGSGPVGGGHPSLVELPDGRFAALGVSNVVLSSDHGGTWHSVGPSFPFPPNGLAYSPAGKAFYIWHFYCDSSKANNPVVAQSIMRLGVDLEKG
jgi:photosystem II stability/assembly factor-like uncharacterized protein